MISAMENIRVAFVIRYDEPTELVTNFGYISGNVPPRRIVNQNGHTRTPSYVSFLFNFLLVWA